MQGIGVTCSVMLFCIDFWNLKKINKNTKFFILIAEVGANVYLNNLSHDITNQQSEYAPRVFAVRLMGS